MDRGLGRGVGRPRAFPPRSVRSAEQKPAALAFSCEFDFLPFHWKMPCSESRMKTSALRQGRGRHATSVGEPRARSTVAALPPVTARGSTWPRPHRPSSSSRAAARPA